MRFVMKKGVTLSKRTACTDTLKGNCKNAFTLAEVLVTLGIIGVVAAMTLPAVVQKYRNHVVETRLQKFYTVFNQAIKLAEVKYGDKKDWYIDASGVELDDEGNPILSTSEIDSWFSKYLSSFIVLKRKSDKAGRLLYYLSDGSAFQLGVEGNASLRDIYFYPGNPEKCQLDKYDTLRGVCVFNFEYHPVSNSSGWKSQFFSGMMMPIMQFVGNVGYVMVALLGGYMTIRGAIQVGEIQSFFQYIRNFTQPVQQIAQVSNMLQLSAASSERVFEFLAEEEEDQTVEHPVDITNLEGNVTFDHVGFGYNPEQTIIKDFSADVKFGEKIAIVGPTGAGKTTMVKLLMRFYDVNKGAICIDGHNVKDFNRSELREMFGMVLQDTWLFNGTIMENIRYGRLDATDEEVIEAEKAAHAHKFIMQQPDGYQTVLNEETSNISQGQKQLLTIARAILADNKILILDEATSSVDTRTEILIQKAMDNLMKGRTSFIIAHRLSTIRDADLILVMKDGDIIEQGNHEELLAKGGFYSQLYNSQFEKVTA